MGEQEAIKVVCAFCGGSGLCHGLANERDGCAVLCRICKGNGYKEVGGRQGREEFTGLKQIKGVTRVFMNVGGYAHYPKNTMFPDGKLIRYSEAGCSYEEFLNGEKPKPVKDLYCPCEWTDYEMQNKEHKGYKFYKRYCYAYFSKADRACKCVMHCKKERCWLLHEKMQNKM